MNIARKKRIPDTRVHCCLYFISPTGHSYVPVLSPHPRAWLWFASSVSSLEGTANTWTRLGRARWAPVESWPGDPPDFLTGREALTSISPHAVL